MNSDIVKISSHNHLYSEWCRLTKFSTKTTMTCTMLFSVNHNPRRAFCLRHRIIRCHFLISLLISKLFWKRSCEYQEDAKLAFLEKLGLRKLRGNFRKKMYSSYVWNWVKGQPDVTCTMLFSVNHDSRAAFCLWHGSFVVIFLLAFYKVT